jgi:hypothetical protein
MSDRSPGDNADSTLVDVIKEDVTPVKLSTGYKVGRAMAVLSLLVIASSVVTIIAVPGRDTVAGAIAICAIILAVMVLFGGVMIALANKPEAAATERLRKSMSAEQWDACQNRKVSRAGWWVSGISLLGVIIITFGSPSMSEARIFCTILGGGGVLIGMIIVLTHPQPGRTPDNRHDGIVTTLRFIGMIAIMLALAAAIARLSWPISIVAGTLSAFEFWALFWGSRSGSLLALRALVQLGLFATVFYAASSNGH